MMMIKVLIPEMIFYISFFLEEEEKQKKNKAQESINLLQTKTYLNKET